jgi:glucoamylase
VLYQLSYLAWGVAQASVRAVMRTILAVGAAVLVAASVSGASEQPPVPIDTALPGAHFGAEHSGPFSAAIVSRRTRPLGREAPPWARRLYRRSIRVLVALTDPGNGALIAGERDGWDYVWPRDAAAGAMALEAAGLRPEARRVVSFLAGLDLDGAARFYPDGSRVPGRTAAGDGEGWVAAAGRAVRSTAGGSVRISRGRTTVDPHRPLDWWDRQDYGENITGDLLGNAIAADVPAAEIESRFGTPRGLVREPGTGELDSAAAWAIIAFPSRGSRGAPSDRLRAAVRKTLLELTRESTPYGIPPMEGWTPGEVWTAPTAWSAWALTELGNVGAADRLLTELHRAETPAGTLPERVDATDGRPTSTTPLAWSHAFAILALRARYPS